MSNFPVEPSRRSFLKAACAAAAGAPYFVPAPVFGACAHGNRIAMGCNGVGNQGTAILQRFIDLPDCQIVAVCDVNKACHGSRDARPRSAAVHGTAQRRGQRDDKLPGARTLARGGTVRFSRLDRS